MHERWFSLVSSGPTGSRMNSRTRLKILSTMDVREAMGQFCGYIHLKLIKKPTEATRERRTRRQSGSTGWKILLCSQKSVRNLMKNGCRRRLKDKYKKHLVKWWKDMVHHSLRSTLAPRPVEKQLCIHRSTNHSGWHEATLPHWWCHKGFYYLWAAHTRWECNKKGGYQCCKPYRQNENSKNP